MPNFQLTLLWKSLKPNAKHPTGLSPSKVEFFKTVQTFIIGTKRAPQHHISLILL